MFFPKMGKEKGRREIGDRRPEAGDWQKAKSKRQKETGDRRTEKGDRRQGTGVGKPESEEIRLTWSIV